MAAPRRRPAPPRRLPPARHIPDPRDAEVLRRTGQFDDAEGSLAWLRALPPGDLELERELGEIREAAEASELLQSEKRGFFSEARKRGVRKRLGVGIGLMIAQNM
ncbi:hypothetical protein LTR16_004542, partial [Cryomyces antarcticus]